MKYQIIYADPPWQYSGNEMLAKKSRLTKTQDFHYKTMPLSEIKNLPVQTLADENCLLFLWVVSPSLDDGIEVLKAWGFEYGTIAFIWHKQRINPGYYTLSSCEICLVGKKGKIPLPRGRRNIHQFLSEQKTTHSKKPNEIRKRISLMFPTQDKIELFARNDGSKDLFGENPFDGWHTWGNETNSDISLMTSSL